MLISEYLALRSQISVTTGTPAGNIAPGARDAAVNERETQSFADALQDAMEKRQSGVEFSKHALARIEERSIDLNRSNTLERLNRGVEIAADKGSNDALVLVDSTAFVVSVKNNKVITTLSNEDLRGNIFTNIDSTVII